METTTAIGGSNRFPVAVSRFPTANSWIIAQGSSPCLVSTFSHFCSSTSCRVLVPRYSRWEPFSDDYSDREDVDKGGSRVKTRRKRRWWSDYKPLSLETDDEGIVEVLEKSLSSFWIFKVFNSFGWTLPPILLSWLLAGGPKAFLMAFSLALGLSVLVFTFDKLTESLNPSGSNKVRKTKNEKRSVASFAGNPQLKINIREKQPNGTETKTNPVSDDRRISNGMDNRDTAAFGGWDTLDRLQMKQPRHEVHHHFAGNVLTLTNHGREPLPFSLLFAMFPSLEL